MGSSRISVLEFGGNINIEMADNAENYNSQRPDSKYIFYGYAILLLLGAALLLNYLCCLHTTENPSPNQTISNPENNSVNIVSSSTAKLHSAKYFIDNDDNFRFIQESGWDVISNEGTSLPDGMKTDVVEFAMQKNGTKCVYAYLHAKYSSLGSYVQSSFADRVFTYGGKQIDSSWYVKKGELLDTERFPPSRHMPLPDEVRIVYYSPFAGNGLNYIGVFVLYNKDRNAVSDDCNNAVSAMLSTVEPYFVTKTIDYGTKGDLFIDNYYRPRSIFYTDGTSSPIKLVRSVTIDDTVQPIIYGNLLYFRQDGVLKTLNVFEGTIAEVPGLVTSTSSVIDDFYIYSNKMFYLVGNANCNDYLASCGLSLYEYDIQNRSSKLLANNIYSRDIAGFDPFSNRLFMYWSDGDGPCFWVQYQYFDLNLATTTGKVNAGSCDDNDAVEQNKLKQFDMLVSSFGNQSTSTEYISIDSGHIIPPRTGGPATGLKMPLKYVY